MYDYSPLVEGYVVGYIFYVLTVFFGFATTLLALSTLLINYRFFLRVRFIHTEDECITVVSLDFF